MVGIYCAVQPIVTIVLGEVVIALSAPPHFGLSGANWADFGALAIFAGLALVVFDPPRSSTAAVGASDNGAGANGGEGSSDEGARSLVGVSTLEDRLLVNHVGSSEG